MKSIHAIVTSVVRLLIFAAFLIAPKLAVALPYLETFDGLLLGAPVAGQAGWTSNDPADTSEIIFGGAYSTYPEDQLAMLGGFSNEAPTISTIYLSHPLSLEADVVNFFSVTFAVISFNTDPGGDHDMFGWTVMNSAGNIAFQLEFDPGLDRTVNFPGADMVVGWRDSAGTVGSVGATTERAIYFNDDFSLNLVLHPDETFDLYIRDFVGSDPTWYLAIAGQSFASSGVQMEDITQIAATWWVQGDPSTHLDSMIFNDYFVVPEAGVSMMVALCLGLLSMYRFRRSA